MKILIVHTYYYPEIKGGAEYSVKKLSEGLAARGHNVYVLCDDASGDKNEVINGVNVFRRKMHCMRKSNNIFTNILRATMEFYNPLNKRIISKVLDEVNSPETVCYTNSLQRISRIVWKLLKKKNIPLIDTQREYRALHLVQGDSNFNKIWAFLNRCASRLVNASVFISKASMKIYLDQGFFSNAKQIVIYNSIDYELDNVRKRVCQRKNSIESCPEFKFVYLGSLEKHKGVDILLDAFKELSADLPNVELHFAGLGKMETDVLKATNSNPKIKYHGWLPESDVLNLLHNCNALVCPSVWEEPFGRVVLDAYKQGMPVIVARSGGLAETVIDGETGFITKPCDVGELCAAMKKLSTDKAIYKKFCDGALRVLPEFSLENQLDKFEAVFSELLSKGD